MDFNESQQIVYASTNIAVYFAEKNVFNFIKLFNFQKYPNVKQKTEINMCNIHKFRMSK